MLKKSWNTAPRASACLLPTTFAFSEKSQDHSATSPLKFGPGGLNPTVTQLPPGTSAWKTCKITNHKHHPHDHVCASLSRSERGPPKLASLASITSAKPTGWLSWYHFGGPNLNVCILKKYNRYMLHFKLLTYVIHHSPDYSNVHLLINHVVQRSSA